MAEGIKDIGKPEFTGYKSEPHIEKILNEVGEPQSTKNEISDGTDVGEPAKMDELDSGHCLFTEDNHEIGLPYNDAPSPGCEPQPSEELNKLKTSSHNLISSNQLQLFGDTVLSSFYNHKHDGKLLETLSNNSDVNLCNQLDHKKCSTDILKNRENKQQEPEVKNYEDIPKEIIHRTKNFDTTTKYGDDKTGNNKHEGKHLEMESNNKDDDVGNQIETDQTIDSINELQNKINRQEEPEVKDIDTSKEKFIYKTPKHEQKCGSQIVPFLEMAIPKKDSTDYDGDTKWRHHKYKKATNTDKMSYWFWWFSTGFELRCILKFLGWFLILPIYTEGAPVLNYTCYTFQSRMSLQTSHLSIKGNSLDSCVWTPLSSGKLFACSDTDTGAFLINDMVVRICTSQFHEENFILECRKENSTDIISSFRKERQSKQAVEAVLKQYISNVPTRTLPPDSNSLLSRNKAEGRARWHAIFVTLVALVFIWYMYCS